MKYFKTLMAVFLIVIVVGIFTACSNGNNNGGSPASKGANDSPLFDESELTVSADDLEFSDNDDWIFKCISSEGSMQQSLSLLGSPLVYNIISSKTFLVQNFSVKPVSDTQQQLVITSGQFKREEVFDAENKTKYVNFFNQHNATVSGSWKGNTLVLEMNDYKNSGELGIIINNACDSNYYTITTNETKTRYFITSSDNKYNYYFEKK